MDYNIGTSWLCKHTLWLNFLHKYPRIYWFVYFTPLTILFKRTCTHPPTHTQAAGLNSPWGNDAQKFACVPLRPPWQHTSVVMSPPVSADLSCLWCDPNYYGKARACCPWHWQSVVQTLPTCSINLWLYEAFLSSKSAWATREHKQKKGLEKKVLSPASPK